MNPFATALRGAGHDARLFLVASAAMGLVVGIYDLTLTLYLHALAFRADDIGLFGATTAAAALVSSLPAGLLLLRLGRRPVLLVAGLLHALALALLTVLHEPAALLAVAAVIGVSASPFWATVMPALTDDSLPEARVHLFAVQSFAMYAMTAFGAAVGGSVPELVARVTHQPSTGPGPLRAALWCAAVVVAAGAIPFIWLRPGSGGGDTDAGGGAGGRWRDAVDLPRFGRLLLPDVLLALSLGAMALFLPLYFGLRFRLSPGALGAVFAPVNAVAALATLLAPLAAQRVGRSRSLLALLALTVPLLGLVAYTPLLAPAVAALYLQTSARTMVDPLYAACVMEQVTERQRTLLGSLYQITWNVGFSLGP